MEIVGAGLTVAGGVMKANAVNKQAKAQATAQRYQAQQMQIEAEYERIGEMQTEATQRRSLANSLETITALQAGRGIGLASPTNRAIQDTVVERGDTDVATAKLTSEAKQAKLTSGAGMLTEQAKFTEEAGQQAALIDLVGTGASVFNLANYGRTSRSLI